MEHTLSRHKTVCFAKNCQGNGIRLLKVKFLDKDGSFCEPHAKQFLEEGLVEEIVHEQ